MRVVVMALILAVSALADKPTGPASAEDENLVVQAEAFLEKADVARTLGQDPGMDLIVVQVKLAPRGETKIKIDLDDFTLLSRKDGQRSQPMAPSQIAGSGALVVVPGDHGGRSGGMAPRNRGPIWGGTPGTSSRPARMGGDGEAGGVGAPTQTQAAVTAGGETENPLLQLLKTKVLPQVETNEAVTGLLYFFLEDKHKLKHLELIYKSPSGRMILDFER